MVQKVLIVLVISCFGVFRVLLCLGFIVRCRDNKFAKVEAQILRRQSPKDPAFSPFRLLFVCISKSEDVQGEPGFESLAKY